MSSTNNISNATGPNSVAPQGRRGPALSDDQKAEVASILKNFDPAKLTTSDISEIRTAFKEAKIPPGRDLRDAITEAGFNVEQLRPPSTNETGSANARAPRPERPPPPPPQVSAPPSSATSSSSSSSLPSTSSATSTTEESDSITLQTLTDLKNLLASIDLTNLTSSDTEKLLTQLREAGISSSGTFVNVEA
jgi:hypothetical protein